MGTLSTCIYLLLGIIGLPVFSGYKSGIGIILGVTGGYLIGYLPLAYFSGFFYEKVNNQYFMILGMLIGNIILYVMGTIWFIYLTKMKVFAAISICVFPFILGDIIKIILVLFIGPKLKKSISLFNNI